MKVSLLLIFFLFSFSSVASECFVVSGQKKDHNNFLVNRNLFKSGQSKIAGKNCIVVGSWKELDQVITAKKLPKGADVLVVQGAHGNTVDEEGNFALNFSCDAGTATADEVMGYLNKFSSNYQVGAVVHSCFSGDLMKDKLLQDETNPKNLDKLCLYTSSSMGRNTYGKDIDIIALLEKAKTGQNLEQLFLKTNAGMISSAAWSEIGLPGYLANKTNEEGFKVLQSLDKITRGAFTCEEDLGAANSALCVATGVTDKVFEDLMTFQNPLIPKNVKEEVLANFNHKIKLANETLKKAPADKRAKSQAECFQFLLKTYQGNYGDKLEDLESWDYVAANVGLFKNMPEYASCVSYSKLLPKDESKTPEEIIQDNFLMGTKYYQESVEKLQRYYSKTKMDDTFDIKSFAKAAAGEKAVCNPDNKQQIIQSMFGESFFEDEFSPTSQAPDEMVWGRKVSTQLALKSFQNASIMKPDMLSEKDKKRRDACRNFKL